MDLDTIVGMAENGVAELAQLDGRLAVLKDTLLSPAIVRGASRDMRTKSENKAQDAMLEGVLRKLSPYFTLPAAHKVMEYLIRRFAYVSSP